MRRKYKKRKAETRPRRGKCVNCHCAFCDPPPVLPHVPPPAAAIHELRLFLGLSQVSFAQQLGVYKLTVSQWEQGRREPRREHTAKLVELAQMNGLDLFNMPDSPLPETPEFTVEKETQLAL